MLWLTLIVVFAVYVYFNIIKVNLYWKHLKVPYVRPWPLVGNLGTFYFRIKSMCEWSQDLYKACQTRYIGIYVGLKPTLLIKDLSLIKQIGIRDFDNFVDHQMFITEESDPLFGKNLFSLRGDKWRNMRATLSPAFTSSKMRSMFVLINECAEQFTNYFLKNADPDKPIEIELKDVFTRLANDVVATTAFGIKCDSLDERNNEFYLMGKDATTFGGIRALRILGTNISPMMMRLFRVKLFTDQVCNFFRNIVHSTIRIREKQGIVRPDLIHLLMEARKGRLKHETIGNQVDEGAGFATVEESDVGKVTKKEAPTLSDDEITAQALLFFMAGFDTISTVMSHMAYELAQYQDIQKRLQEEIDLTLESCEGTVSYETVLNMKYLDMVLSETLRKWPPVTQVDRVCVKSYVIEPECPGESPIYLRKGDLVWFPVVGIHRDPEYYPNPDKFDPERFNDENKGNIKPMTYIPFGVGPRNCIGSRFALLETKVVLVNVLSKFTFVLTKKSQVPLKLKKAEFNLDAENGFWLGLKLREERKR